MNQSLPISTDLTRVFPDIEGQLCSRHSILFGKLKNTFGKVYDHMQPENYIIIKGVLDFFSAKDVSLSMALQNGIILMTRKIDCGGPIYVNSNHLDSQLIMTADGKLEEGLSEYVDQISMAIRAATEGVKAEELMGGIFYLHSNIVESYFRYKEAFLISIFIGASVINNTLKNQTVEQMLQRMAKLQIFGDSTFLDRLFNYQNRKFTLTVGQNKFKIPLEKQNKMIILQLDLAKQDIKFQQKRKKQLQQRKCQILRQVKQKWGLDSFLQIFQLQDEDVSKVNFRTEQEMVDNDLDSNRFVEISLKQLGLLSEFNNGNITFQQLVSAQWELNSKYWKLHSQEVVELVQDMKEALKINSCMIIQQTFALIIADRSKYTQLLVFLRQKLHKGQLKSKSLFKIEEELIQHRWSSDKHIGEKMFTSVPSCGISVYDPSEAIWFD